VTLPNPVESAGTSLRRGASACSSCCSAAWPRSGRCRSTCTCPRCRRSARTSGSATAAVQYSLASFFVGFAVAQLIAGPLVDRHGRRRPLLAALALYILASLGCAAAPSNDWLIACRLLQGLAGSMAVVVPRAVVRDLHSGTAAVHMLSRLMLVMGVAPIVAPLLGSWVLAELRLARHLRVPRRLRRAHHVRLPAPAARDRPPARPDRSPWGRSCGPSCASPDFRAYTLCGGFSSAGMFAYIAGSAFVFIEVHHVDPEHYGYIFGVNAFGLIAASQLNRVLVGRFTAVQVLGAATSLAALAALALLAVAYTGAGGLWGVAITLFLFLSSLGILGPNSTAGARAPRSARRARLRGARRPAVHHRGRRRRGRQRPARAQRRPDGPRRRGRHRLPVVAVLHAATARRAPPTLPADRADLGRP
jgi:DHA1 family bicyclomycin/chloramphenicol resistance-like MFS transporter